MKGTGKIMICMAKASTPGPMAGSTKVSSKMIKNMGTGFTLIRMVEATKVCGSKGFRMVKVLLLLLKANLEAANGRKEREYAGQMAKIRQQ